VLTSLTIANDGKGNGADWHLQDVNIYSAHWLKPDWSYHYAATLNDWVKGHSFRTLLLTPQFPAPQAMADEFAWGATDWGVSDGSSIAPWKQIGDAYTRVLPGGSIHVAPGQYAERLMLTKPCTLEFWSDHGAGLVVIGSP
jgi:hypothetical protein